METRRLGRTGHNSTVAILGGFAFFESTQSEADILMETVIDAGINHIDVAPSYGNAEKCLGPWMARERDRFFLGCKTWERSRENAWAELQHSLNVLQTDSFDLYQLHAITTIEELDQVTRRGGALEAAVEAREKGLTRFIGITGHGMETPDVFLEALNRFDFDTVMFPLNFVLYGDPKYREQANVLIQECHVRNVGIITIKVLAKGPWGDKEGDLVTWYEPFTDPDDIQRSVNFVLSQDVSGFCTTGDPGLVPLLFEASEYYSLLPESEQDELIATASHYSTIFDGPGQLMEE
ncbi:MAG: aldo/keto reductase [Anaerolineales bacterium]|nr:aldo/keto reductase [Anaerolineales bacterium]